MSYKIKVTNVRLLLCSILGFRNFIYKCSHHFFYFAENICFFKNAVNAFVPFYILFISCCGRVKRCNYFPSSILFGNNGGGKYFIFANHVFILSLLVLVKENIKSSMISPMTVNYSDNQVIIYLTKSVIHTIAIMSYPE